jgi:penicillin-binding protein 1A
VLGVVSLLVGSAVAVAALWAFTILPRSLPPVTALESFQPIIGSKIFDDNDELITELHVERRIFVPLAQIPQSLRNAVIATEDRRFYSHWGVDPIGVARAAVQNYRRRRISEGGSTITQQLTKVLFLTPDRSMERKLKEAVLALELERRYSKDRILEMYLNQVYFGHGAYGVEAAARTYFGKSVSELNVRESALIAGLPRAPSNYSPFDHPDAAKLRRELVFRRMVEFGALKDADAKRLTRTDLGLIPAERRRTTGQYFLDYVQQTLEAKYGADLVFKGGLRVYTTLNPAMQLQAERALREGVKALETRTANAKPGEHPEGAIITIEPQTGYVKAMVGGYDFFRSEFNRAVQAKRQPGSAFKPFVYIAALESGFTAASRIDDSPVTYPVGRDGNAWKPENYDRKFRGSTTLQQALEESVNVVTVKLQERIGINRTIQVARRLGVSSPLNLNLTLALGSSDLTLLELTSAYGVLANQGVWMAPSTIRPASCWRSTFPKGKTRCRPNSPISPLTCFEASSSAGPDRRRRRSGDPSRRRPGRPTITPTRGSSASRRDWRPGCGWGTTARAASGVTKPARAWRFRSGSPTCRRSWAIRPRRTSRFPTGWCCCRSISTRRTNVHARYRWRSFGERSRL